jgi:hypothetical protein
MDTIEQSDTNDEIYDLYSGSSWGLISARTSNILTGVFMVLLSPFRQIPGEYH